MTISAILDVLAAGVRFTVERHSGVRRGIMFIVDCIAIVFSVWLSFFLRLDDLQSLSRPLVAVMLLALAVWIIVASLLGTYRNIVRLSGNRSVFEMLLAVGIHMIVMTVILVTLQIPGVPRTVAVIHALIMACVMIIARMVIRDVVTRALQSGLQPHRHVGAIRNVLIYGAGSAGRQLLLSFVHEREIKVRGFIDDNVHLANRKLEGLAVYHARSLEAVVRAQSIGEIVLAMPSATRSQRRIIMERLQKLGVQVRTIPDMEQILRGKLTVRDLHEVMVDDLLGRQAVSPDPDLLKASITGKKVMVTGAGGSIGSELARQLYLLAPSELVLVEMSEFGLFAIENELVQDFAPIANAVVKISSELGNCAEAAVIDRIVQAYRPDTIFHAAAYKHVPLVERNPIAGATNNIFGTLHTAMAAQRAQVGKFILVSTDKAVRPTNVMGATKRVCEMILQALSARGDSDSSGGTVLAMVRFGNVLGSSGSVVPHFRKQIEMGGPITVTSRLITRYFMTIPEAAQLVVQAGAMARGGEVFLLDMGEPVLIQDLAETMIRLSGLEVRSEDNPEGDIAIVETGLRPGEKLYEELLIDSDALPTAHPAIFRGEEPVTAWDILSLDLTAIRKATLSGDSPALLAVLAKLVPGFGLKPDDAASILPESDMVVQSAAGPDSRYGDAIGAGDANVVAAAVGPDFQSVPAGYSDPHRGDGAVRELRKLKDNPGPANSLRT